MPSEILDIDNISLTYKTMKGKILAIENMSFKMQEGEFVAIVGPSGCGKSTLLKVVSGLMPPTKGMVKIKGKPITGPFPGVSMCFQSPILLQWRNVRSNIHLPLEINPQKGEESDKNNEAKIDALLKLIRLEEFEDKHPFELSGGMQQRVSIARALITNPELLLMDEPFGALDEFTRQGLGNELVRIWEETNKSILYVTHNIAEAVHLATKVIVLACRPAKVIKEFPIKLERPRKEFSPEFVKLSSSIRELIVA